ncbi:hypothetical protein FLAG1_05659 [Fusarium langsethiae]|uniref:Uncharacterized protein n=1 Tax=Fusarium langsethiae TaxID=179993 RepID=A0A0M9EWX6_FUSLA|nr:hypothetical protein FLAG1_05659 [Fusarium langsethiae]GKU03194.1 unnamed protein product [Fusarium langsethiae]GKU18573.1 unnamed protein product [Fusarium langsethiae]
MLPKRLGALHILKPLSKGPSLVRFKNYKADITQDRWPAGLTPEARPYSGTWKHPDRNYYVPFTIYNVPNNSEAYVRWPTLKNFRPTLNPRAWRTVKPGGSNAAKLDTVSPGPTRDARAEKQLALMPYMYHDLGVLIYEGPTEKQLKTIGHMLKRLVKHEGRLQARAWNATLKKVHFDKWNVYRLSVDERNHIDKFLRERGFLLPSGLDELTDTALQKWRDDWKAGREAEGRDGRLPVGFVKDTKEMWLLKNKDGMGLVNETINGPRIASVDAYVATAVLKGRVYVNVELHTVGTKRFLGCASFQFEPSIDHDIRGKRAEEAKEMDNASPDAESQALKRREERKEVRRDLQNIYNHEAPASIERQEPIVHDMTRKLWRLERLIWKDRVDALRKEMQEKRMLEWKRQKELRKSVKAQAKADVEGIEKPSKKEGEI